MRASLALWAMTAIAIAAGTTLTEGEAYACGGCFHEIGERPTVVTDHRMVFTISKTKSTLYDQIKYSGDPTQFAWVLPISGTVTVGLSSNIVFTTLDSTTQTTILPPPRNCPSPPSGCFSSTSGSGGSSSGSSGSYPGVNVIQQQIVGPYLTVQLSATTPNALQTWLADNGFNVPSDVAPIIAEYQAEHFNFLALKLLPDKGVTDMRPVRVTTDGANVALPLRMVAAGTGAKVGITLWVIAEGRYEPQNFGSFYLGENDIAWDWQQSRSNYTDLRTKKAEDGAFSIWEVESSANVDRQGFDSTILSGGGGFFGSSTGGTAEEIAARDYLPVKDSQGTVTRTAAQVRDDDLAALFNGISGTLRVTRMRADLARAALVNDLLLRASNDQALLPRTRQITKELNQPLCPVYTGCQQTGQAPRDQVVRSDAGATANANGASNSAETFSCATTTHSDDELSAVGLGVLGLAAVLGVRQRSRRSRR